MAPRFSSRLPHQTDENPLSQALRARRARGLPIVDLTESNPSALGLAADESALAEALASAPGLSAYAPDARGPRAARELVAAHEGHGAVADDLLLTASTSEAYALLFKLLCDPGDCVLAPRPSYPLFEHLAALEGVRLAGYPLRADDDWRIDRHALAEALAAEPRARAILVVSPGNPTGAYLARDDLRALEALAAEHELALIVDEVFARYPSGDEADPARVLCAAAEASGSGLCFSLGGLSKSCALPQLKLGWIRAGGPAAARREALARLELIADTYLSVSTPVLCALPRLLELGAGLRARVLARVRENRAALAAALADTPALSLLPAQAGWSALVRFPSLRAGGDEALALAALDHGLLAHPGHFFDLEGGDYLVLSLLPLRERLLEGAQIMRLLATP